MPVPSLLSLTDIPDGSQITASPHRNNYSSIQSAVNALIGFLTGGSAGDVLTFDGTDWAPAAPAAGTIYRKTTEKDVVNTVAETDLLNGEITVAAGVMGTNKTARISLSGDFLNNTGASANGPRFKVKFGGVTIVDVGTDLASFASSATRVPWRMAIEIANLGAANSQWLTMEYWIGRQAPAGVTGLGANVGNITTWLQAGFFSSNGPAAIDTSLAKLLEVTVVNGAAHASYSTRLKRALVEVI